MAGPAIDQHRSSPNSHIIGQMHHKSTASMIGHEMSSRKEQNGRAIGSSPEQAVSASTRSVSQPGASNNVGELVSKAKKAAASLWMILHAQNCRMGRDNCPYTNCSETKMLLVHVKTCAAGPNFPCPTKCKGCNETRKLLAHYRRCKDMRMKQVGAGRRASTARQQSQACLVCSLMARHAKNMMDKQKMMVCSQVSANTNHAPSVPLANDPSTSTSSSMDGKFNVEKGFANISNSELIATISSTPTKDGPVRQSPAKKKDRQLFPFPKSPSMLLMPPPPPRPRSNAIAISSSIIENKSSEESFGSPPTTSQLMHSKIAAVAAITDPCPAKTSLSDPSLLGKSVDSSCSSSTASISFSSMTHVPFPDLKHHSLDPATATTEVLVLPVSPASFRRQRSVSCDERKSAPHVSWAPNFITESRSYHPDEGGEEELAAYSSGGGVVGGNSHHSHHHHHHHQVMTIPRPRSASCSNMVSSNTTILSSSPGCETIAEEGMEHEEVFEMEC